MSLRFEGTNRFSYEGKTYYFSYDDFLTKRASNADSSHIYLGLGTSMGEWYDETSKFVEQFYRKLLPDLTDWLRQSFFPDVSGRQVEILFGNLAHLYAKRMARAFAQSSKFSEKIQRPISTEMGEVHLRFAIPQTTTEAIRFMSSKNFGSIIEQICLAHWLETPSVFNLAITWSANSELNQTVPRSPVARLKEDAYSLFQRMLSPLAQSSPYLLDSTYLGRFDTIRLSLRLSSIPLLTELRTPPIWQHSEHRRDIQIQSTDAWRHVVLQLFSAVLPLSLLEEARATRENASRMGYSNRAKLAFTSNSYSSNDEFKLTVAESITSGTKYVVGQHGGDFGTSKITKICPEMEFSDAYLSWGWSASDPKVISFGQIKPRITAKSSPSFTGVVLFMRAPYTNYVDFDMAYFNEQYYSKTLSMLKQLGKLNVCTEIRFQTGVDAALRMRFDLATREMPTVKIATTRPSMAKLIDSGRLPVFTYDSTGMLELASSGLPFHLFAPDGLDLIRTRYRVNYEILEQANVLTEEPKACAEMIYRMTCDNSQQLLGEITTAVKNFGAGIVFYPDRKIPRLARLLRSLT